MRHLPNHDHPPYVSDRLSAISNLRAQFLIGACVMTVIMIALSLADFMPTGEETARMVDGRTIGSVGLTAQNGSAVQRLRKDREFPCAGPGTPRAAPRLEEERTASACSAAAIVLDGAIVSLVLETEAEMVSARRTQ